MTPNSFDIELPGGARLDVLDGTSSAVQRCLRRTGIAGFEPDTMAAILAVLDTRHGPTTFYDVGANIGLYAATAKKLFPQLRAVAFEPTPTTAVICEEIMRRNGLAVSVERRALGRVPGTAMLYLSATSDSSNSLVEGFKQSTGEIEVTVTTVDAVVDETGVVPDLVKIDAETFEPEILRGARRTLERHRPTLIVEVLHRRGYDHGPDVAQAMAGLGYSAYRIGAMADWLQPAPIAGDQDGIDRDWLLVPGMLDRNFPSHYDRRRAEVAACTAELNRPGPSHGSEKPSSPDGMVARITRETRVRLGRVRRLMKNAAPGRRSVGDEDSPTE